MNGTYQEYIYQILNKWKGTNANPLSLLRVEKYALFKTTSFYITGMKRNKEKFFESEFTLSFSRPHHNFGYTVMLDLKMSTGSPLWHFSA